MTIRTIIKTFGYSSAISNLLTVPPYVFASQFRFHRLPSSFHDDSYLHSYNDHRLRRLV
jgi:hypothetical protein